MLLSRKWKCSLSNSFSEMPETFTLTLTSLETRSFTSKLTAFSHSSWIIHPSNFVHYSVTMTMDTELTQENFLLSQNKFSSTTTTHLTEWWTTQEEFAEVILVTLESTGSSNTIASSCWWYLAILSILPIIDIGHFKIRFADNFFFFFFFFMQTNILFTGDIIYWWINNTGETI